MAFAFACSLTVSAQLPQWQDMHKVKKGETVFGIAKEYSISIEQLLDANPEMKEPGYELKKGTWVRVPFKKDGDKDAKDVKQKKKDKTNKNAQPAEVVPTVKKVRVGVILPLHNVNGDGRRMVEYYRGL
jgi:murein DD-endopeptidase MepM/ murein hydrolase activator NlpD